MIRYGVVVIIGGFHPPDPSSNLGAGSCDMIFFPNFAGKKKKRMPACEAVHACLFSFGWPCRFGLGVGTGALCFLVYTVFSDLFRMHRGTSQAVRPLAVVNKQRVAH